MFDCHMKEGHVMLIPAPQMLPEQLKESSKKEVQELLKKNKNPLNVNKKSSLKYSAVNWQIFSLKVLHLLFYI